MPIGFPPTPTLGQQWPAVSPAWECVKVAPNPRWASIAAAGVPGAATPVTERLTSLVNTDDFIALRAGVPNLVAASVIADYVGTPPAATAPAAFTAGQWTAAATAVPGQISFNLSALPSDGGSAITALEYRVGAGAAIAFVGLATGVRLVTAGLSAGVAVDLQVRAVNAVGAGSWSDTKNRTPLASGGGGLAMIQRTNVARASYVDAVCTFPADVTAGNTIVIFGGSDDGPSTITASPAADPGTQTVNQVTVAPGGYRTILGYITDAVGGPTTVTANGGEVGIYAEEWPPLEFNAAAGFGVGTPGHPVTASTAASDATDSVAFTVWVPWVTGDMTGQVPPAGYTAGAGYLSAAGGAAGRGQFMGAYKIESTGGVKSATWTAPEDAYSGAQIMVMGAP